ncbi:MAG: ABC transporter ATP-binding protein [Chloroflexota bacterium]
MPDPLVWAEHVGKRYGTGASATEALCDVNCAIYRGERIVLTGPSGSGKSTLLHLLGGLDLPTQGTITWPALGTRDRLRPCTISYVFQGPSLLPTLSVIENVMVPLLLAGFPEPVATLRAATVLERFGLAQLSEKLPDNISGGQAQRVAIARAVVIQPKLLLADEPTGQLDSASARDTIAKLLEVLDECTGALLLATHDLRVAERFTKCWTLRDGRLATGPSVEVDRRPGAVSRGVAVPERGQRT